MVALPLAPLLPALPLSGRCNHYIFRPCKEEGRDGSLVFNYLETRRRHWFSRSATGLLGLDS